MTQESISGTIVIEEFDVDTVKRMLDFLYTGGYSVAPNDALRNIMLDEDAEGSESKHPQVIHSATVSGVRKFTSESRNKHGKTTAQS